jgi:TorA-specific chaperone
MDSRAQTYGFLARLFRIEVDQKLFDEMRAMRFPTATGNAHVDKGYELIYTYLKNGWSESILDLARDYVRVFIGHGMNGHSAAYPYESVHTSEKRLMMQEARAEVLQVYRANELKKDQSWREGEDHIAVELEFMQIMCLRTAESLRAGDEDGAIGLLKTQYAFVQDHLLNWVPLLVADMLHFSETELYRGLAELTLGFVQTEAEILEDLLQGVDEADRG